MQQKSNVRRNALLAYAKQLETSNNKNTMRIISGHMAEIYVKSRCEVAKITAEAIEKRQSAKK